MCNDKCQFSNNWPQNIAMLPNIFIKILSNVSQNFLSEFVTRKQSLKFNFFLVKKCKLSLFLTRKMNVYF